MSFTDDELSFLSDKYDKLLIRAIDNGWAGYDYYDFNQVIHELYHLCITDVRTEYFHHLYNRTNTFTLEGALNGDEFVMNIQIFRNILLRRSRSSIIPAKMMFLILYRAFTSLDQHLIEKPFGEKNPGLNIELETLEESTDEFHFYDVFITETSVLSVLPEYEMKVWTWDGIIREANAALIIIDNINANNNNEDVRIGIENYEDDIVIDDDWEIRGGRPDPYERRAAEMDNALQIHVNIQFIK